MMSQSDWSGFSVGMNSSDESSKNSKGSVESRNTDVVEEVVIQCGKQVEVKGSKKSHNGKENWWNRKQYNAGEGYVDWGKKLSYKNGGKDVNFGENRSWAPRGAVENDGSVNSSSVSSGYNKGKQNRHFDGNRKQYNDRGGHAGGNRSYGVKDVNLEDDHFWSEQNFLAHDGILPNPYNPSRHNNAACRYGKKDVLLLSDSSQPAASSKRVNRGHFVSLNSQRGCSENDSEKSVGRSTSLFKSVLCDVKRGPRYFKAKSVSCHRELSPGCSDMHDCKKYTAGTNGKQTASHSDRHCLISPSMHSKMSTQEVMNDVQQDKFRKIPSMEHEVGKSVNASASGLPGCHTDHKLRKDVSVTTIMQRPAAGTEGLPVDRISSANIPNELKLSELSRKLNSSHLVGTRISCHQPVPYDDPEIHQSELCQNSEIKSYDATYRGPEDADQFLIGSHMNMKALADAYQMQLASETIQLTTGFPLAEFETFIQCATPVIPSSCVHNECSVSLCTQPSQNLLRKHQIPNVSLNSVWNWYEIPGNYGLDVKASCPKSPSGLPNDSMSFHAYFVPSLSAIQLFGQRKRLFSNSTSEGGSFDAVQSKGSSVRGQVCSTVASSNAELVLEFFEVELPHFRRPFHNKILELIAAGTSNPLAYGDPSKLASLDLCDLHPASWFSVAWYPIYRIPEGRLHASFLTYHSLGHFVLRPDSAVAPGCIFFPVLGLQSYNSQDECWFEPKIPSSEQPALFDSPEILIKRLRILDENAMHFARGWVYKDNVKVQNKHPDYKFFTSRKTSYK